jgi:predicted nucleotidyltransferase
MSQAIISSDDIKRQIAEALPVRVKELVIFSDTDNDIDIAIVLEDGESKIHVIELLSDLLVRLSVKVGKLITVTPLHASEYAKRQRAFVINVAKAAQHGAVA